MRGSPVVLTIAMLMLCTCGCGTSGDNPDVGDAAMADSTISDNGTPDVPIDIPASDFNPFSVPDTGDQDAVGVELPTDATTPGDTADETINDAISAGDDNPADDSAGDATRDAGADAATDTITDKPGDSGQIGDAGFDAFSCPKIACNLDCPDGYKTDDRGCPVCRCRECETAQDCDYLADFLCDTPVCNPGGDCTCDCAAFEDQDYRCPDGTVIALGRCSAAGVGFLRRVEEECPTLCGGGESVTVGCPDDLAHPWCTCQDVKCRPECREIGTRSEGWYDGCDGGLIEYATCSGHQVLCAAIGTKSEAWVGTDGTFLGWGQCAPGWTCDDIADACPTLECAMNNQASGTLTCPSGATSEFCSCDSGLWTCFQNPAAMCGGRWRGCVRTGEAVNTDKYLQCCAGLTWLRPVMDNGTDCVADDANPYGLCTECGNASCDAPEDRCNCPEDCLTNLFPGETGSACRRDTECPPLHECPGLPGADGICTAPM